MWSPPWWPLWSAAPSSSRVRRLRLLPRLHPRQYLAPGEAGPDGKRPPPWKVGDVQEFDTFMAAVIDQASFQTCKGYIDRAAASPRV